MYATQQPRICFEVVVNKLGLYDLHARSIRVQNWVFYILYSTIPYDTVPYYSILDHTIPEYYNILCFLDPLRALGKVSGGHTMYTIWFLPFRPPSRVSR